MKQKMIVTNLRISENDMRHFKSLASDLGMSMNEYAISSMWESSNRIQLGLKKSSVQKSGSIKRTEKDFWNMHKIMDELPYEPMGASDDDKAIYGIED